MSKPEVALDTLDEVFLTRSKIGKYFSIPDDKRNIMLQYFQKNPYPKKEELTCLSQCTQIEKNKIQNWFKYQRQKDFKTDKTIIKSYKSNRKFTREGKKLLELYFRKNHELTENGLKKLSALLKCEKSQIERWFYYRNKKLNCLIIKKDNPSLNEKEVSKNAEKMQFEIKLDEERPDPISEIQIKSEIKTPFTFPNFTLPHPPLSLVLGASLMSNCFGKVGENFGQMLPNLAMLNGFLLKRNEMLQNTVNFLMQNQRKEESIKKEDLEDMPKIKEENDV